MTTKPPALGLGIKASDPGRVYDASDWDEQLATEMDSLRVLMIAPQPFFEPRGTPISIYQRLKALTWLGHKVDLVSYHIGDDVQIAGVTLERIPSLGFIKQVRVGPSPVKAVLDVIVLFKSAMLLFLRRYDVIHTHEEASAFGVLLSKLFGVPHVYDMHSSLPRQLAGYGFGRIVVRLFEHVERFVLKNCDAVITIDDELTQYAENVHPPIFAKAIENLPISFGLLESQPRQEFRMAKRRLIEDGRMPVIYTGTFEKYQGLDVFIQAVGLLPREVAQRVVFVMVGGRSEQVKALAEGVAELGLEDTFIFTGSVSLDEAYAYLELAEILVTPRLLGTSVPLKIYSYQYAERAILATRIWAHTQILTDETALLVEPDPGSLAEGLVKLVEDKPLRQMLAKNAKQHADEQYDKSSYLAKVEAVYARLPRANLAGEQAPSTAQH